VASLAQERERIRIGVLGAGEIAQTTHLPNLEELSDLFHLVALAEPSRTAREALERRYRLEATYPEVGRLLEHARLDAVAICSPNSAHAEAALMALDAGLHVFVEKPLCITLGDADRIVDTRDRASRVVQIGYMNRYDLAYERMWAELPSSAENLRAVNVLTHDPNLGRFFQRYDTAFGGDVPEDVIQATRRAELDQVEMAVGSRSAEIAFAFSEIFLGTLVHDVNLVHGLLEKMGEPLPAAVVDGAWWADGKAAMGASRLANGARWNRDVPGGDGKWLDGRRRRQVASRALPTAVPSCRFSSQPVQLDGLR
jgi:GFO/IDH/MocA oxidoreductase family protein